MSEQRKYRSWTAKQKLEIVLAGLKGDRSVRDVCREHGTRVALDVHQASVSACVRLPGERDQRREFNERFGATTPDLLALCDWLHGHGVTHVAMEGTGVYWKPVYYALEGEFELLLVNAAHVKQVPGRKTDTKDAAWLCQLLECGLLKGELRAAAADPGAA